MQQQMMVEQTEVVAVLLLVCKSAEWRLQEQVGPTGAVCCMLAAVGNPAVL
jgi:hypothetical protein